jgi:hypothetical protein
MASAGLATAAEVWPAQTQPLNEATLKFQLDALDTAVKGRTQHGFNYKCIGSLRRQADETGQLIGIRVAL